MAFSRNPKWPIYGGTGIILLYFFGQFSQPFISTFKKTEGILKNHTIIKNDNSDINEILKIWISGFEEPFFNEYPGDYSEFLKNIDKIKNEKVTIWYSKNQEIMQFEYKDSLLIDYDWFNPWLLLILGSGISFHWLAFREMKEKCFNIKTIWDMYDYTIGGKELIMKYNNKPYNPKDLWKF